MSNREQLPSAADARAIAEATCGEQVRTCERFTTGLRHWVYDTVLESGRSVVVRLSHPANRHELQGGVFWTEQLALVGVPVPEMLAIDTSAAQPYVVLERLEGTELGNVFDTLDPAALTHISRQVAAMQQQTALLAPGSGFGYATSYATPLRTSWSEVLDAACVRAQTWIEAAGVVDQRWVHRVRERLAAAADSFDDVRPLAFLHDATTKNVIVSQGQVSGLVDVDEMAFGDPLWTPALTRTSLLSAGRDTSYVEPQYDALDPAGVHRERFELYTSLHCLTFLGELGQTFNQAAPEPVDAAHHSHLEAVLGDLLRGVAGS